MVYLIFFLTYTPIATPHVLGVQGRYFVIALPAAAIFLASVINVELPRGAPAAIAIAGSLPPVHPEDRGRSCRGVRMTTARRRRSGPALPARRTARAAPWPHGVDGV
jgi:hypothetical protein